MRSSSLLSESICRSLVIILFALDRFQVGLCVFNCALSLGVLRIVIYAQVCVCVV